MPTTTERKPTGPLVPLEGRAAAQLAFELGADITPSGLALRDDVSLADVSYEDWENLGRVVSFFGSGWQFSAGDWILWGEELFGEDSAQAVDPAARGDYVANATHMPPARAQHIARICQRIARARRRTPPLSFAHHEVVASLAEAEQDEWLEAAVANAWTRDELRDAIRDAKAGARPTLEVVPEPRLSRSEQIEMAARAAHQQAQPAPEGGVYIPAEPWARLEAALGEE